MAIAASAGGPPPGRSWRARRVRLTASRKPPPSRSSRSPSTPTRRSRSNDHSISNHPPGSFRMSTASFVPREDRRFCQTTAGQLSFSLDESHQLQSEAESLRAMLNAVRFTLVRRLGTGGMGVVYEAYDRKRGELVALKTMRRADPLGAGPFQAGVPLAHRHHPSQPGQPLRAVRR